MTGSSVKYLKKHFDEIAILTCLAEIAFNQNFEVTEENQTILSAIRRSSEEFRNSTVDEIGELLSKYTDDQIEGLVSNVKGIAHEMEFLKIENEDGNSIYASIYPDLNHPGFDVQLFDETTGDHWPVQLKATDDASYVNRWIDEHPEGEIIITDELAEEMNIEGSGIANSQITAQVKDLVDELIKHEDVESLTTYFPMLTLASLSIIIWELWTRYRGDQISFSRFKLLAGVAIGKKTIKVGVLITLLSIPGLDVVVGAALVAQIIYSTTELASGHLEGSKTPNARSSMAL